MAAPATRRAAVPLGRLLPSSTSLLSPTRTTRWASHHHHHTRSPSSSPHPLITNTSAVTVTTTATATTTTTITHRPYTSKTIPTTTTTTTTPQPHEAMPDEPTGPIATAGLELFTLGTPNGYKASVALEELREAYGDDRFPAVTYQTVDIMKNTQKEPWYTAICPNGRIPALVDHDRADFPVFEGLAILAYLARRYDPDHRLSFPPDSDDYSVAEQWMAWQHGGLGPMQGQANHFLQFAKEKIPYGIQRYVGESERLYGILDARLKDRDFVAGPGRGRYSIADISILGWANIAVFSGIDLHGLFPHVAAWLDRCLARPGTKRGFAVPKESFLSNAAVLQRIAEDPDAKQKADDTKKLLDDAKAQYGYKYASP